VKASVWYEALLVIVLATPLDGLHPAGGMAGLYFVKNITQLFDVIVNHQAEI
jgi:hypothetical protein